MERMKPQLLQHAGKILTPTLRTISKTGKYLIANKLLLLQISWEKINVNEDRPVVLVMHVK